MDMSAHPRSGSSHELPKETTQQTAASNSPPPAYTPPRPRSLNLAALAALEAHQSQSRQPQPVQFPRPMWTSLLSDAAEGQDETEGMSPISLRINTSVNVSKSNNLICLAATPADHANAIAQAVVQAIQRNSSGQCGIPMIDEDGRPRPVNIEVDASMVVEGSGNVIGGQDAIMEALRERRSQQRPTRRWEDDEAEAESSSAAAKRRRSC
ncbi:hypothetical protein HJFPF1_00817 [Paramyrothecium foliicola]|nr:hypothetical protein HJFPF1_00817 [Paramyrothecium foliicola]